MAFVSYAQNFEDVLLWRALRSVEDGQYLDIGAHDPIVDSVSMAFYQNGWRGTSVEPLHEYASRLREARPDERVIEAAVTEQSGLLRFFMLSGLSSGRADIAAHHAAQGNEPQEILVSTVRLDDILDTFEGPIHWMKIDVEGMEDTVLRSWGNCEVRPWILIVEATFPNSQTPTEQSWIEEVLKRDYREVHFDGLSRYFVHGSQSHLEVSFNAPPNVFDQFCVTKSHFSSKLLAEEVAQFTNDLTFCRAQFQSEHHERRSADAEVGRLSVKLEGEETSHRATQAHAHEIGAALSVLQESETQAKLRAEEAQLERIAVLQSMAAAERDHSMAIDKMWREREMAESNLHDRRLSIEVDLRAALVSQAELRSSIQLRDAELNRTREELNSWKTECGTQKSDLETLRNEASQLTHQIAQLQNQLAASENVIIQALAYSESGWRKLQTYLGFRPKNSSRRILQSWARDKHSFSEFTARPVPDVAAGSNLKSGLPMTIHRLDDLLELSGQEFVIWAYRVVLGREADPDGFAHYFLRLKQGKSKLAILAELADSAEAKAGSCDLNSFRQALRRRRRAKFPLVGGLFPPLDFSFNATPARQMLTDGGSEEIPQMGITESAIPEQLQAVISDLARLKGVVEGLASAVEGISKTQKRHHEQISEFHSRFALSPGTGQVSSRRRKVNAR